MKNTVFYLLILCLFLSCNNNKTEEEYWENGMLKSTVEYKDELRHGKATYYFKNGSKQKEYTYVDGKLEGITRQWSYKGTLMSSIEFSNDMMNGKALYYDDEGKLQEELHYKNDSLHGLYRLFYPNGEIQIEGEYKNAKFHGKWKYYDYTTVLVGEAEFDNGSGIQKAYHLNGKLKRITHYVDNEKQGEEIWYDEEGKIIKKMIYDDGKLLSEN